MKPTAVRIVVDISDLSPVRGKSRGIYSYAQHLICAMVPLLPRHVRMSLLCNGDALADFAQLQGDVVSVRVVYGRFPSVLQRVAWCVLTGAWAMRSEKADIYFSPKGFAPLALRGLGRVKQVAVTIHDLIPFWYARHASGSVGRLEQTFVNGWLSHSARTADTVIAVSQATADALCAELARCSGVRVVPNGVPHLPSPTYKGARDCIFALTSTLAHKNAEGVLAAYAQYRRMTIDPLPLIVCGLTVAVGDGVSTVTNVPPVEMANLYARARAFLFLPFIEGFGFPVREAIAHGAPVVCSDIPSLRESTGGAADFVAPRDATECARALVRATTAALPIRTDSQPLPLAEDTWQTCAHATLNALIDPARFEPQACGTRYQD